MGDGPDHFAVLQHRTSAESLHDSSGFLQQFFIRYDDRNILGSIEINSKNGIYGQFYKGAEDGITLKKMPVAYKQDVKTGEASVLCNVDGEVREYQAEIKRIDLNHEDTNKSFVIQITDEKLLEKTGGIVQGLLVRYNVVKRRKTQYLQGIADMIQGVESSPFLLAGIEVLHDHSVGLNAFGCSISRPDMSQSNCCQVSCFTSN